jgi:hypothetical protein
MILYNVTVNVEDGIHDEWLKWMRTKHIPDVMRTGMFEENRMFKLLSKFEGEKGTTYSIQYFAESMRHYEKYQSEYAPKLQKETAERYGNKIVAFRTLLQEV